LWYRASPRPYYAHNWDARQEVVIINGQQVHTFEDFLRAVEASGQEVPEVLFFPPLAGGSDGCERLSPSGPHVIN
jgi:hypothetical protein